MPNRIFGILMILLRMLASMVEAYLVLVLGIVLEVSLAGFSMHDLSTSFDFMKVSVGIRKC